MSEIRAHGRVLRLSYSMNVHPCESVDELLGALRAGPGEVRRRLFPDRPCGAGLRLSAAAAEELASRPERLEALRRELDRLQLFAFTANAFPYGSFNAGRVKENVFRPSWADPRRLAYTIAAGHALAALGGGASVTLSTVAGGWRPDGDDRRTRDEMARNLAQAASALHTLREESGVSVRLCLEPEPGTTCETVEDTVEFFRRHVYPGGERALRGTAKYNPGQATDILHEHLGLCYDCCHQAVLWEDPVDGVERLERSGIPVGKVQMTCALEGPPRGLARFAEPRYFHQVAAPGGKRAADLEGAAGWDEVEVARAHFHVPIFLDDLGGLRTTRGFLEAAVGEMLRRGLASDFEIETYTWDVIPEGERKAKCGETLIECLVREYGYAMELLGRWRPET
jgi:hypothetical protein